MAHRLRFHTEVEQGNVNSVQQLILQGVASANENYLGVFPLDLAVEKGDIDMAAMLLTAGADPTRKGNGKNRKSAEELARELAKDKKDKRCEAAKRIVKFIEDEKERKAHFDIVQDRIFAKNQADLQLIRKVCWGFWLLIVPCMYYFLFHLQKLDASADSNAKGEL